MAKRHLLLVDADPHSLRVMEVSLRQAGFAVTTAVHGLDALEKAKTCSPDLVISDVRMPELDGFELCKRLRADEATRELPFIFLTPQKSVDDQRRGLELGVEDYLSKPLFIKEIVTRVKLLLARRDKERLARDGTEGRVAAGDLSDLTLLDLVQVFDAGRKTGAVHLNASGHEGHLFFREGKLVDAECGKLAGAPAFDRLLRASGGTFEVDFAPCDRADRIAQPTQALLAEGLRRVDEWGRMLEQLPPLSSVLEIDDRQLSQRLAEIPDEVNGLLRLFDGRRSMEQIVDDASFDALAALEILCKLYFEGFVREVGKGPAVPAASAGAAPAQASGEAPEPAAAPSRPAALSGPASHTPPATVIFFHAHRTPARAAAPKAGQGPGGPASGPPPLPAPAASAEGWFNEPAANGASAPPAAASSSPPAPAAPTPADIFFGRAQDAGEVGPPPAASEPPAAPEPAQPPSSAPGVLVGGAAAEPFQEEGEPEPAEVQAEIEGDAPTGEDSTADAELQPPPRRSRAPLMALAAVLLALLGAAVGYQRLQSRRVPAASALATAEPAPTPAPTPEPSAQEPSQASQASPETPEQERAAEAPEVPSQVPPKEAPSAPDVEERANRGPEPRAQSGAKKGAESDYARLITSGYEKFRANRVGAAAADFGRALALRPNGSEALIGLGIALVDREPAKAAAFLERGLALNPKDARGQVTLGAAYQTLNRNADAVRAYNAYLSIAPHGEYADEVRTILENLR